jgi:hypothetical protein
MDKCRCGDDCEVVWTDCCGEQRRACETKLVVSATVELRVCVDHSDACVADAMDRAVNVGVLPESVSYFDRAARTTAIELMRTWPEMYPCTCGAGHTA